MKLRCIKKLLQQGIKFLLIQLVMLVKVLLEEKSLGTMNLQVVFNGV